MTTLRELSTDLIALNDLARDPEVPAEAIADTVEGLAGIFNDKAIKVVHVILNNDADVDMVDREIKRLQDRKKVMVNARDRLKEYLRYHMTETGITKIESPLFTITLAKGRESVVIEDEQALPQEFQRVKTEPNRLAISAAIKAGQLVPGAHIEAGKSSVRIK